MILEALDQSRRLAVEAADKTRIAVTIPSALYVRLCQHTGLQTRAMSRFCIKAIEHELERG